MKRVYLLLDRKPKKDELENLNKTYGDIELVNLLLQLGIFGQICFNSS